MVETAEHLPAIFKSFTLSEGIYTKNENIHNVGGV